MAELTDEQKAQLEAIETKIESGEDLSADEETFLTESVAAIAETPAEEPLAE